MLAHLHYDIFILICWHAPSRHLRMVPRANHRGTDARALSNGAHRDGISHGNDAHDVSDVPWTRLAAYPSLLPRLRGSPTHSGRSLSRRARWPAHALEKTEDAGPTRIGPAPTLGAHARSDPRSMGSR